MSRPRAGRAVLLAGASLLMLAGKAVHAQPEPRPSASGEDAVSGFESAGNLLRKCRENAAYSRSYCFAYLGAVADASRAYRVWLGSGDPCLPQGLTLGRLADIFEAYLVANPSQTRAQAASVIVASLQEAFPCSSSAAAPLSPPPHANSSLSAPAAGPSQPMPADEVKARPQQDRRL